MPGRRQGLIRAAIPFDTHQWLPFGTATGIPFGAKTNGLAIPSGAHTTRPVPAQGSVPTGPGIQLSFHHL
ncbi:hypothetical protein FIBSPDRAFT_872188 [Athelia psychrophila]|uniref:Uncharacterized protein n=1 Tax=Athelia psychrophila TaxID=1759441 RepID=A0A165ZRR0_9AGAM|nr:hypothetical protein FIBSPDRAFT_872188 [Fibularhizoctonia sp. CBS 109695]